MTNQPFRPRTSQPTGGVHPVKRFKGKLAKWADEPVTYDANTPRAREVHNIHFWFRDCEILELMGKDAYNFRQVDFVVQYQDYTRRGAEETRWEALASSLRTVFGREIDLNELQDKDQEWTQLPFKIRQPMTNSDGSPMYDNRGQQVFGAQEAPCWQLTWFTGLGSGGTQETPEEREKKLYEYLAGTADGKTDTEFYMALVGDQQITNRDDIMDMVTEERLVDFLISQKVVFRGDDGKLGKF